MAEIRDAFDSYASGALAEFELRQALRAEVSTQPDAVPRYVAMAAALRRRKLISAELEAAVVADMHASLQLPNPEDPTKAATRAVAEPVYASGPSVPSVPVAGKPSGWDSQERLSEPEAPVTTGLVLRERFQLFEELGRGGMGVVYKALDQREIENHGREPYVAIKVLNEDFKRHPESARALQRESKKSMRLAHPNIVLVRDFDRDRGNVFMVMELLHGQPLDQLVQNVYPKGMPADKAIPIVTGLGAALSYAHQQGIVHADFKPSNAFLTNQNVVKVLDFGVARVALALDRGESTVFDAGKLNAVSPAYASIELLVGEQPDARDDIYALGCVTYFLLTGRHPYNGTDAIKARDARIQPARIPNIAEHQWRAIRAALVFERYKRTPSVREFVANFCTDTTSRAEKIANTTTKVVNAAIERPWFSAAPVGALLAAAIVVLLWRQFPPQHKPMLAAASVPPASAQQASTQIVPPVRESVVASLDPTASDYFEKLIARLSDVKSFVIAQPADESVKKFQAGLAIALANRVDGMLERGDLPAARKLLSKVTDLLPPGTARAYSAAALARRQQLVSLMTAPAPTQQWADQMSAALRTVANVAPADDPLLKDARDSSDVAFRLAADDARAHQRMDEARELLAMGISVNPQSPELTREALEIATSPIPVTKPDGVDKVKPQQVAATSTDGSAKSTALPHIPAITAAAANNEAAPQTVDSYLQKAKQQMASGNTQLALDTIAGARKKFGGAPALKSLEITYDRVEEEVERINSAPSLNVASHQEWIAEIRSLSGEDFPAIEQMLAQTLANDIADQRASGDRPNVVASLLSSGRKLFPEYAAVLEHGTAGTQDPRQIMIADEPADPKITQQAQK